MHLPCWKKARITPTPKNRVAIAAALLLALAAILAPAAAPAATSPSFYGPLEPAGHHIYFGVSDTGDPGQFGEFAKAVGHHPPVIESFRTWGDDFPDSITRWQTARARPMIHITTADSHDGHELITPKQIALGGGDDYLVRLNKMFWARHLAAYLRPLGEPNRCLNVYASFDCAGKPRGGEHSTRWYRLAFRRIYVIAHGGGTKAAINRRLAEAGVPPLSVDVKGEPKAPIAVVWSPLPSGSPTVKRNLPQYYYPGSRWVDWVGTDFYASYQEWRALNTIYARYPHKPFALTEWGIEAGDDPGFVDKVFAWVKSHSRAKMLVYYQDFGSSSPYRIQNYPTSLERLRDQLRSPLFPSFAKNAPHRKPPPPLPQGGLGTGHPGKKQH
jgi:hypothetical protein